MTKLVFGSHEMVAHVWNAQTQYSGRVSGSNRVFFENRAIYSYGNHYVIGFIMPDGTALLNSDKYSISTSKHQSLVRHASSNRVQLHVPALSDLTQYSYSPLQRVAAMMADGRNNLPDERDVKAIRAHVEKHCDMADESACYLLGLIGVKKPAAVLAKIRAADAKAKAKAKAAQEKAARDQLKREAIRAADMSDAEFKDYVAGLLDRTYVTRGTYPDYKDGLRGKLPDAIKSFWKYARTSSLGISKTRIAKIKARRLALAAKSENFIFEKAQANRHATRASLIRYVREFLPRLVIGQEVLSSSTLWSLHHNLSAIASLAPMTERDRVAFRDLSAHAKAQGVAMAEIERAEERARQEAAAAARAERQRLAETEAAAARERWFAGDTETRWHGSDENGRAYVRAIDVSVDQHGNVTGGTLQTSHGAEVPLTHAIRAFRFLKLCHDTGRTWHANGKTIHVGAFRIETVTPEYFKAGCHTIGWTECERVATELGVFDLPADDTALVPSGKPATDWALA